MTEEPNPPTPFPKKEGGVKPPLPLGEGVGGGVFDALVIGAGPAGAVAARELARRGASVLLVDKSRFPRPKVCGCCVNGAAVGTLKRHGNCPFTVAPASPARAASASASVGVNADRTDAGPSNRTTGDRVSSRQASHTAQ